VNSATAGDGDVQIEVRAPSGRSMKVSAVPRHGGNYISNFNPTEVGMYTYVRHSRALWDMSSTKYYNCLAH
jgi:hypothetical protein